MMKGSLEPVRMKIGNLFEKISGGRICLEYNSIIEMETLAIVRPETSVNWLVHYNKGFFGGFKGWFSVASTAGGG